MNVRHGESGGPKTGAWRTWQVMRQRCLNKNAADYPRYGGRGITICERWLTFEHFRQDMGPRPLGMTLDRIDNNRGYEPGNCRWATRSEQGNNKRTNHRLFHAGATLTMAQWARRMRIRLGTLSERLRHGWPVARALTEKVQRGRTRSHCAKGHAFTETNTRWAKDGSRRCRECLRQWKAEHRAKETP